jgi:hypothetical protein
VITRARLLAGLAAAALAASVTTACAHRVDPGRVVVKTVVITPTPTVTTPTPTPTPTQASPSTSPVADVTTSKPAAPKIRKLPGTCNSLMPLATMVDAAGHKLPGDTTFVVGKADPDIGRMTYLNCRYGVSHAKGPTIEVTVSLYRTASQAAQRVDSTTDDFTYHGATATHTTIAKRPATLLLGAHLLFYGPTVVLAHGQRTVAVTLRPGTAKSVPLLEKLGKLALLRTA